METDPNLSKYAELIEKQPGWRFDLFVLGPDPQVTLDNRDAKEPSEEEIRSSLDNAERMFREGFVAQSVIAAWAALESAMRLWLRVQGEEAGWDSSPRTMLNELFSSGVLSNSVFRDLERLFQLRNVIVHGFSAPPVEGGAVRLLAETARQLLEESRSVKQTA
jgi:hypothetical protein